MQRRMAKFAVAIWFSLAIFCWLNLKRPGIQSVGSENVYWTEREIFFSRAYLAISAGALMLSLLYLKSAERE